jgi:hypothetical protein
MFGKDTNIFNKRVMWNINYQKNGGSNGKIVLMSQSFVAINIWVSLLHKELLKKKNIYGVIRLG